MNCQKIPCLSSARLSPRLTFERPQRGAATLAGSNKIFMAKKSKPEEAFYENLTLGLKNTLTNVPRICDVRCEMRQPCEKAQVVNWEQRHSVYLPEDMKKFYLSTDGFTLQWSYQYAADDTRRVGLIHFPHLLQITLLRENVETTNNPSNAPTTATHNSSIGPSSSTTTLSGSASAATLNPGINLVSALELNGSTATSGPNTARTTSAGASSSTNAKDKWGNPLPVLTPKTKIFELNNVNDVAKVCLIYESTGTSNPKIYLLELNQFRWQFLSDSFSEYLRMSIAHLGLPYWELCFSSFGLPSWTEQLFLLLAPHLLEEHEPRRSRLINPGPEHPYNVIDPNIFRAKPKSTTKPSTTNAKHK